MNRYMRKLKEIINQDNKSLRATVVESRNGRVILSTSKGAKSVKANGNVAYKTGDIVYYDELTESTSNPIAVSTPKRYRV